MNTQHNMAEMAAIGLLLLYPQQAGDALGLLRAEMFEAQPLADIFPLHPAHAHRRARMGQRGRGRGAGAAVQRACDAVRRVHGQRINWAAMPPLCAGPGASAR